MVEIYPNLFVGTTEDYEAINQDEDFFTVIAAKDPYHRQAVGYTGRSCGKDNPEYLYAERERCLICNLVDVENPDWISPIIINKAFEVIDKALFEGNRQVLICCNQGKSRSASIGLMYMKHRNAFESCPDFKTAEECFKRIYTNYVGVDEFNNRKYCMGVTFLGEFATKTIQELKESILEWWTSNQNFSTEFRIANFLAVADVLTHWDEDDYVIPAGGIRFTLTPIAPFAHDH